MGGLNIGGGVLTNTPTVAGLLVRTDNPVISIIDSGLNGTVFKIKNGTSGNGVLTITDNDDVRLRLDNAGFFSIPNTLGVGDVQSNATGTLFNPSDKKFKKDIKTWYGGLKEILKIIPKSFKYNKKSGHPTTYDEVGFIAQELEEVIPIAVHNNDGRFKSITMRPIIGALVNAVKELHEEIQALKKINKIPVSE